MAFNYSPKIVTDGLVLYLDAANTKSYVSGSTTWNDISRLGNNGTLVNGPTFDSTRGGGIVFDGTNDYVECGNMSSLILSNNQFTINCWLLMTGTARGDFFNIKNFNPLQDDIGLFIDTDNKLYVYIKVQNVISNSSPGSRASVSTATLIRNTLYNICCIKDSTQKIVIYINGALDNNTYSSTTNTATVATSSVWVGSNRTDATTPAVPWAGNIYNISAYNRALTAQEVLQNYNATKTRFGL